MERATFRLTNTISKLSWIKTQKKKFENQERETPREFVSGESHYFLGDRYLLNVVNTRSKQRVEIANNSYVNLYAREDSTKIKRENIMNEWYRSELKKVIPDYIKKWEKTMDKFLPNWRAFRNEINGLS